MYIAEFGSDVVRLVTFTGSPATITVASGSPQTTRVNTNFAERLTAAVRDSNGIGVSGVTVTFAAPAGGASATLSSPTAITDTSGRGLRFRYCEFDGRILQRDRNHNRSCDSRHIQPDKYRQCFR